MRIAVTGATGRLGGAVVHEIAAHGSVRPVALTRRQPPEGLLPAAAEVRQADYGDVDALHKALDGVDTLVLVSSDGETAHVMTHHANLVGAAVAAGVSHIAALSSVDADTASPFCYAMANGYTEDLIRRSGIPYSLARASIYAEFFGHWLTTARTTGTLRLPAGDGRIALVSRADVGHALAALALGAATGRHHDITGPAAPDVGEIAEITSRAWGVPVRYEELTPAEYLAETARAGEDPWWLYAFTSMFASVREGRWAAVSGEYGRLTGRVPAALQDVLPAL
ncbi:NAD(P)H-binding protein [Streptomyces sp. NPDC051940]|uniref:NmrA family NAD(P)-binding protein n=1 Tax=Streptomyces sp. NPDC051940 TaxID=3155675 RepID=UPI003435E085